MARRSSRQEEEEEEDDKIVAQDMEFVRYLIDYIVIGFTFMKGNVLVDKIPVDPVIAEDFITDGIRHGQIGLGFK